MKDNIELYILVLVQVTLTLIQATGVQESKKLLCQLSQFSFNLDGILHTIEFCWPDELHSHFIIDIQRRTLITHPKSQLYEKKSLCTNFLANFLTDSDKILYAVTIGLLKPMPYVFYTITI